MCGSAPKAPKPQPNYELMRDSQLARDAQAAQRASYKKSRLDALFGLQSNRFGRAALFSAGPGGAGFDAPRAMQVIPTPNGI